MISIKNLSYTYDNRTDEAVKNITLDIKKGESVVIIGSSGSGKSTLLRCINRLIEIQQGNIFINGKNITKSSIKDVEQIRGNIGMIFQNYNIIENETVIKNVLHGRLRFNSFWNILFNKYSKQEYDIAKANLEVVDLVGYENEKCGNLSGGQKQRVAIARTLSQQPIIILADEPVSSLDPKLMKEIMDLLRRICIDYKMTLVCCLHFLEFAKKYGTRIIGMKLGRIVYDGKPKDLTEQDLINIYGEDNNWHFDRNIIF